MGLFSGLSQFGLGKLEKMDVFEEEKKEAADAKTKKEGEPAAEAAKADTQPKEADILFDKSYTCPVCGSDFHTKVVRTGRIKLVSQDTDLRPKYNLVDSLKYDAVACPSCGYAALSRFFKFVMPAQAKMIKENISANFKGLDCSDDIYTYDDAIARHQLALANTVVKKAKDSEKAYTCLKLAWLCRGKAESLPKDTPDYANQVKQLQKEELELLTNACDGFMSAFMKEDFPMCGMDEMTTTYLVAELARRVGRYEESSRWVSRVLTSRSASDRIKDKARDIKEMINQQTE